MGSESMGNEQHVDAITTSIVNANISTTTKRGNQFALRRKIFINKYDQRKSNKFLSGWLSVAIMHLLVLLIKDQCPELGNNG